MFPLWALSGLKFLKPVARGTGPIYVTKEELTTVTLFYDAYYDFGIAGVFFFSSVLGVLSAWLSSRDLSGKKSGLVFCFIPRRLSILCSRSLQTWYSNPTTWFYFGGDRCLWNFLRDKKNKRRKQL